MRYRRANVEGGTYFFTVNLADRTKSSLIQHVDLLRTAFRIVKDRHPFIIEAIVIMPEHLHSIWTLPEGDTDYPTRWALIKSAFSRSLEKGEQTTDSRVAKGERGIWQRRYWEHVIRSEDDFARHVDYIHYNPVKHGHARTPKDWAYSSFHLFVSEGLVPIDWGGSAAEIAGDFGE